MTWHIAVDSELRVVGYDPENADMDRPHGEVIIDVYFLVATNDRGDRRAWGGFETDSEAEVAIPDAPPIFTWDETYPEYGSVAWQKYGEDDQIESERRMAEAEDFGLDTRFMIF